MARRTDDEPEVGQPPRTLREEITNLPNMLTIARIVMIPPVMGFMMMDTRVGNFIACVIFALAAVTDWLDGFLARRRGLVSVLGKFLDPLADKLIVLATLVIAAELHRIPGWFVVLLLSREVTVTALRAIASREGLMIDVVQAGKYKTALQLVGLVALILHETFVIDFLFAVERIDFNAFGIGLLGLSMVFSLWSAVVYFARFLSALSASRRGGAP